MLFHIVGIKETIVNKYNIDILVEGESERLVKDLLKSNNIIVLNFSEYQKPKEDFGSLFLKIDFKGKELIITTYLTDIEDILFSFLMIGFSIKQFYSIDEKKFTSNFVKEIIEKVFQRVKDAQNEEKEKRKEEKEKKRVFYKDSSLEKVINISKETFVQVDELLEKVGNNVSQDKTRDLRLMKEELTKLKMSRNNEKMLELLEKIYNKFYQIEDEYLGSFKDSISYPISGSLISNIDIILENQKLNKAKKVKQIGAKRDVNDNYYLIFESTGLYFKFFWKDFKNKIKDFSNFLFNIFDDLEFATIFIICFTILVLWFKKVSYFIDQNLYNYLFLTKAGVFGLVLFFGKRARKSKTYLNVLLLFLIILIYIGLFWFFKTNLSL